MITANQLAWALVMACGPAVLSLFGLLVWAVAKSIQASHDRRRRVHVPADWSNDNPGGAA